MAYNLRPRYEYEGQPVCNQEMIRLLNVLGIDEKMHKYDVAEHIKNLFLQNMGIDPYNIYQGFAFEGIRGELAELNTNYGIALEVLGLMNYIPTINKIKDARGHVGYSMDGIPVSLRDAFRWLECRNS